jgi:hypothetical protein
MSTATESSLPELHPGTPDSYRVSQVELTVVRLSPRAVLVDAPDHPREQQWLPRSLVTFGNPVRQVSRPWRGHPIFYCDVCHFSMPMWLYRKIRERV